MKKKILICLLCVFGLFCGLTCFAADDPEPGIQNPDFVSPEGYSTITILDLIDTNNDSITFTTDMYFASSELKLITYTDSSNLVYIDSIENKLVCVLDSSYVSIEKTITDGYYYWHVLSDYTIDIDTYESDFSLENACVYNMGYYYDGNIASAVVDGMGEIVGSVGGLMLSIITAGTSVFYNNGLTIVGWLSLITLAIGLFLFGLRFIRGLINKAKAR